MGTFFEGYCTCSSSVSNPVCLCAVCMTSMHVPLFVSQAAVVGKGERRGRGETLGVRGVRGWERRERGEFSVGEFTKSTIISADCAVMQGLSVPYA